MPETIVLSLSVARSTLDDLKTLEYEYGQQFVYDEVYKLLSKQLDTLVQKAYRKYLTN